MNCLLAILAALSIWEYPARFPDHVRLSRQFAAAVKAGDAAAMERTCRQGVELLPDDPTWRYNLACSLAHFERRGGEALDELEKAVDLGFRDLKAIRSDSDLKRLEGNPRYRETIEYAEFMQSRPILSGPLAAVGATVAPGGSVALGEQNLGWDFGVGCFVAKLRLEEGSGGNAGDLYMNRDDRHSLLGAGEFPGLANVTFDSAGTNRNMHLDMPNVLFPHPVFGNCSRAYVDKVYWRSLPRLMMTADTRHLPRMQKFYLSNQIWVFPANCDVPPVGTNGDVFASIAPYWIQTAGKSWSDLPYLRAALEASRSLPPDVKREIVRRGMLAPVIQTLLRKSLRGVADEDRYLTPAAHPTAFAQGAVDTNRLAVAARAMTAAAIPPLAPVAVKAIGAGPAGSLPELTYGTLFAWAFVLRSDDPVRIFEISAGGASEYAFVQTHGEGVGVKIERKSPNVAKVTIDRRGMSPTNRVDVMVCGRNPGTGWGAPSYVSFARMDPDAAYSDPVLTPATESNPERK